ncbi:hypothetical protein K456DRAFT_1129117 [Colletotrichum gloeosporioides 23]|nr:hypothetical protein K456DRAFT_1129117 [Colletotrichum gloeosporioides 23]
MVQVLLQPSQTASTHTRHVSQACCKRSSPTPTSRSLLQDPPFRSLTCDSMRRNSSLYRVVNKLLSSPLITACETPSSCLSLREILAFALTRRTEPEELTHSRFASSSLRNTVSSRSKRLPGTPTTNAV